MVNLFRARTFLSLLVILHMGNKQAVGSEFHYDQYSEEEEEEATLSRKKIQKNKSHRSSRWLSPVLITFSSFFVWLFSWRVSQTISKQNNAAYQPAKDLLKILKVQEAIDAKVRASKPIREKSIKSSPAPITPPEKQTNSRKKSSASIAHSHTKNISRISRSSYGSEGKVRSEVFLPSAPQLSDINEEEPSSPAPYETHFS